MRFDPQQVIDRQSSDSVKWCSYDQDVLPLWIADMDFPSPEPVIQALRERVEHGIFGYGMEPAAFRSVIVERLQALYGWAVAPVDILFVPGILSGLNLATHAITSPGDGLLAQTPIYHPILYAPGNAGCSLDEMELTRQADGRYDIDFDAFEAAITDRTRIFVLCNPHNPVGRVFTQDELERMAEICLRHNVVICSDEIHCDLVYPGYQHIPIASLDPRVSQQTITLLAPSKTFNIAGLHCSVAIIENKELREQFEAAKGGMVPQLDIMGYTAGLAAYQHGQPWLDQVLDYLGTNLDFLCDYVEKSLPGLSMWRPEGTYLAWLDCRQAGIPYNAHKFFLKEAKVALNDGVIFGKGGEGFVRLNFGCPRSTLVEALERMAEALHTLDS